MFTPKIEQTDIDFFIYRYIEIHSFIKPELYSVVHQFLVFYIWTQSLLKWLKEYYCVLFYLPFVGLAGEIKIINN